MNHYYPFGGVFDQTKEGVQPYKFGGKELDRTYGLDLYDYSARYMDGALGRFTTMDPLSEKYYAISPYAYCNNNPMRFVDPTGMSASPYYDVNGKFLGVDENDFKGDIYITDQETFDANSIDGVADSKSIQAASGTFNARDLNLEDTPNLSPEAESAILTDVLLKMKDPVIKTDNLYRKRISIRAEQIRRYMKGMYENIAKGFNNPSFSQYDGRFQGNVLDG